MNKILTGLLIMIVVLTGVYYLSKDALPTSSLFYGKRVTENIILATKQNPAERADYYAHLLDVRLHELTVLFEKKEFDTLISASLRYSTNAGRLAETVASNNLSDHVQKTKEQFDDHKQVLQTLADGYQEQDDRWKFIIDAKNYLDIYEQQLP